MVKAVRADPGVALILSEFEYHRRFWQYFRGRQTGYAIRVWARRAERLDPPSQSQERPRHRSGQEALTQGQHGTGLDRTRAGS